MKRKHFTKSDRLWCYSLLKLIKDARKRNQSMAHTRCPKPGKKKTDKICYTDKVPHLINTVLKSKNMINEEELLGLLMHFNQSDNIENKKKVSFADRKNENLDTYSNKYYNSQYDTWKDLTTDKSDIINYLLGNQNIKSPNSINPKAKVLDTPTEKLSLQALKTRLDKLKNDLSNGSLNEYIPKSLSIGNKEKPLIPNTPKSKVGPHYELNKNTIRKIPLSFLREIKDVIPGGLDDMMEKHIHRKVSKPETIHSEKMQAFVDSPATVGFMNKSETFNQVSGSNVPKYIKGKNADVNNLSFKKKMTNYRDISSSLTEDYKRISLALQNNRIMPGTRQNNKITDVVNIDDSLENLNNLVQGKKRLVNVFVGERQTRILNKFTTKIKASEMGNRIKKVSKPSRSTNKNKCNNIDLVRNVNRMKKSERAEKDNIMIHGGCDCYLKNLLKDREPYLNRLRLSVM